MQDMEDAELLQAFLEEAREHLDGIEGDLIQLESSERVDEELVNKIFRAVHPVKGAAGFFGLDAIKNLSHSMENVLGLLKKRAIAPSSVIIGALLQAADALVEMIHAPEQSNGHDVSVHVQALDRALSAPAANQAAPVPEDTPPAAPSQASPAPAAEQPRADAADRVQPPLIRSKPIAGLGPPRRGSAKEGSFTRAVADRGLEYPGTSRNPGPADDPRGRVGTHPQSTPAEPRLGSEYHQRSNAADRPHHDRVAGRGAVDFIAKPAEENVEASSQHLAEMLRRQLAAVV